MTFKSTNPEAIKRHLEKYDSVTTGEYKHTYIRFKEEDGHWEMEITIMYYLKIHLSVCGNWWWEIYK